MTHNLQATINFKKKGIKKEQQKSERERDLVYRPFGDRGHQGPYSPYKPFNHNLCIGTIIFPHIDNPQSTGYN